MAFTVDREAIENLVTNIIEDVAAEIDTNAEREFKIEDYEGFSLYVCGSVSEQLEAPLRALLTGVSVPS